MSPSAPGPSGPICYFSTVIRGAPLARSGEFVALDWATKRVLARVPAGPLDADSPDPNPRGGRRGGRGLLVQGDRVYGLTEDAVEIYDRALVHQATRSNPLLVGLHELAPGPPGRIWVTATTVDAVVEVDLETGAAGRQFWPREDPALARALGLVPLDVDKTTDLRQGIRSMEFLADPHHLHLNAVASWRGDLHALFNAQGVVVNLDRSEVVLHHDFLMGAHNTVVVGDRLFVSCTRRRHVCEFDLAERRLVRALSLADLDGIEAVRGVDLRQLAPSAARRALMRARLVSRPTALPLFVRGLHVEGDLVYVGVSPAAVVCLDWPRGTLVDLYQHAEDVHVAMSGLTLADPA